MPVVIKWWRAHHGCSESDADRVATKALDALLQRAKQLQDSDPAMDGPYRMPVNTGSRVSPFRSRTVEHLEAIRRVWRDQPTDVCDHSVKPSPAVLVRPVDLR